VIRWPLSMPMPGVAGGRTTAAGMIVSLEIVVLSTCVCFLPLLTKRALTPTLSLPFPLSQLN
jgi:hypothetical protein